MVPSQDRPEATSVHGEIRWEIDIPLATNPRMLRTVALATLASVLIPILLLAFVFGSQGDWDQIPPVIGIFAVAGACLFVAFVVIMAVPLRNRVRTRYTIGQRGIAQETIDATGAAASRLAVAAGILGRSPGAAGAGLVAIGREAEALEWTGAFTMSADPRRHLLVFGNAWRPLMDVYCTPENYTEVAALARRYMSAHATDRRLGVRSPLPRYLLHTVLVVAASYPVFAAYAELGIDLLMPLIMLAFALATIWLVPLFGYVVLACNAWVAASILAAMLEVRTSFLHPGVSYRYYEVFSNADWSVVIAAFAGLAYVTWLAVRAARGRLASLLMRDAADMGG